MRRGAWPIAPTKSFAGLVFVLLAMWYAAASQNNAAAYVLLFALGAVFCVSIPHTLLNLGNLRANAESAKPVFAEQEVSLPIEVTNRSRRGRYAIRVELPHHKGARERIEQIPPGKSARVMLRFAAPQRGEHTIEHVSLSSAYPLGFLRSRQKVSSPQQYLIYPKPAGDPALPSDRRGQQDIQPRSEIGGGDDFAGVRDYIPGESQRHIDWKAVARGQPLMTKQFARETAGELYLDFANMNGLEFEARLSQLALWVIEAERARRPYGLRLPGREFPPALGEAHFHRCLRALALHK